MAKKSKSFVLTAFDLLYLLTLITFCFISVIFYHAVLIGGIDGSEGNVLAYNPANGMYGPVCDNMWNLEDVCNKLCYACFNNFTVHNLTAYYYLLKTSCKLCLLML
jgi:hypothetical protein